MGCLVDFDGLGENELDLGDRWILIVAGREDAVI